MTARQGTDAEAEFKPVRAGRAGSARGGSRWARTRRVIGGVTTAALGAGILVGLTLGRGPMQARAALLRPCPVTVKIAWPPLVHRAGAPSEAPAPGQPDTWLDESSRTRLERLVLSAVTADPFDTQSLAAAQGALMRTGWFATDCVLRRGTGGVILVHGQWRIPAAVVRSGNMDRLISTRGELLEPQYAPDTSGLRIILGARPDMPTRFGDPWIGGEVQAGLALLDYLRDTTGFEQVYAIDVSGYRANKRLVIVTDKGNQVLWGGRPDEFNPGQARADVKRQRLAKLRRELGRIDAGRQFLDVSLEGTF